MDAGMGRCAGPRGAHGAVRAGMGHWGCTAPVERGKHIIPLQRQRIASGSVKLPAHLAYLCDGEDLCKDVAATAHWENPTDAGPGTRVFTGWPHQTRRGRLGWCLVWCFADTKPNGGVRVRIRARIRAHQTPTQTGAFGLASGDQTPNQTPRLVGVWLVFGQTPIQAGCPFRVCFVFWARV